VIEEARVETYRQVDRIALKAWILGDVDEGQVKPAVVLFFGGAWRFGSPDALLSHASFLVKKGMICVLADYRVSNRHGTTIADSVADAKAALTWTRQNAARLGIDAQKIAAGGASSGGHLAACSALVPGLPSEDRPDALLLLNPALVLAPFENKTFGYSKPLKEEFVGADAESLSPIHHLGKEAPPTWIAHGTRDVIVPIETSKAFRQEMLKKGGTCELLEAKNMPHAFHYRDPWFSKVMQGAAAFFVKLGWIENE